MKTKGKFGVFGVMAAAVFGAISGLTGRVANPVHNVKLAPGCDVDPSDIQFRPAPRAHGSGSKPRDTSRVPKRYRLKTRRAPFETPGYGQWLLDLCREQNINRFANRFGNKANPNNV